MFNFKFTVMILSQDLDYLFGEGHRRYVVPFCTRLLEIQNNETVESDKYFSDENHYFETIEDAQARYNEVVERDDTYCASLAVVIDDTDGEPFSNGAGFTSLLEAVSDISQIAAKLNFYTGDSRVVNDAHVFIDWAIEFEKLHIGVQWGVDEKLPNGSSFPYGNDYRDAIDNFTREKIWLAQKEDQD
jgi:hypothetical protein